MFRKDDDSWPAAERERRSASLQFPDRCTSHRESSYIPASFSLVAIAITGG